MTATSVLRWKIHNDHIFVPRLPRGARLRIILEEARPTHRPNIAVVERESSGAIIGGLVVPLVVPHTEII